MFCAFLEESFAFDWSNAGLDTSEECSADLYGGRPKGQRRRDASTIGDASSRDHRQSDLIGNLGNHRENAGQRLFCGLEERCSCGTSLEAGGDDHLHASLFERYMINRAFGGRSQGSRQKVADPARREPVLCHRASPRPERWLLSGPQLPLKEFPPIPARTRL